VDPVALVDQVRAALDAQAEVLDGYLFGSYARGALSRYCDYVPQLAKIDRAVRGGAGPQGSAVSPGRLDASVVRRHLLGVERAMAQLARHAGKPLDTLRSDLDEAWAVERGLQLCAQNALDVATHIAAAAGAEARRGIPDRGGRRLRALLLRAPADLRSG